MDALFRCKSEYTKELVQEFYEYCCFKKPINLAIHAVCAALMIFWLYMQMNGHEINYLIPGAVAAYYVLMLFAYYASVHAFMKRSGEVSHSGVIRTETLVFQDCIKYMNGAGEPAVIEYTGIKNVFCTKNIIAVQTLDGLIYMLEKSGFKVGTADEFLSFLAERGVYKKRGGKI